MLVHSKLNAQKSLGNRI